MRMGAKTYPLSDVEREAWSGESRREQEKISTSNFFVVTFRPRLDTESPLSARQTRLFQFVAGRTRTTKEEAATFLAVSGDTALRELRVLRDVGLVERGGVGKAAFYQRAGHRPG